MCIENYVYRISSGHKVKNRSVLYFLYYKKGTGCGRVPIWCIMSQFWTTISKNPIINCKNKAITLKIVEIKWVMLSAIHNVMHKTEK